MAGEVIQFRLLRTPIMWRRYRLRACVCLLARTLECVEFAVCRKSHSCKLMCCVLCTIKQSPLLLRLQHTLESDHAWKMQSRTIAPTNCLIAGQFGESIEWSPTRCSSDVRITYSAHGTAASHHTPQTSPAWENTHKHTQFIAAVRCEVTTHTNTYTSTNSRLKRILGGNRAPRSLFTTVIYQALSK